MRSILILVLSFSTHIASAHGGGHEPAVGPLVGEVIDLTCYASHAGEGAKHAKCALDCIKKGNPVAILSKGLLYAVISSDHESPNTKLAPFAGKQVVVTGEQSEKAGMHFIDLQTVVEQPAEKKP